MLTITVPGFGNFNLEHAVFDYNGTLAISGKLIQEVKPRLEILSHHLNVHIITGDSFGTAKAELANVNCKLVILPKENQAIEKETYIDSLNPTSIIAIGNGRNDVGMLNKAAISMVVLGNEGAAKEAINAADIIIPTIYTAFDLLDDPRKMIATLRS